MRRIVERFQLAFVPVPNCVTQLLDPSSERTEVDCTNCKVQNGSVSNTELIVNLSLYLCESLTKLS